MVLEQTIDLRPYLKSLLSRWYLILGIMVASTLVFFGVSYLLPQTYKATALVTITNLDQFTLSSLTIQNLDPSLNETSESDPLIRAYTDLATSDELLEQVLAEISSMFDGEEKFDSVDDLREILTASTGSDISLLRLSVRYHDPKIASAIVNTWAIMLVPWVNNKFDSQGMQSMAFFEEQLVNANDALNAAEANLIEFQSVNRASIISNELAFYNQTQVDYLNYKQSLFLLKEDAENLLSQLMRQTGSGPGNFAEQLTALNLQLSVYNAQVSDLTQLEINAAEQFVGATRQEYIDFLNSLISIIEVKQFAIDASLDELDPKILSYQQQLEEALSESRRLYRNRDAAEEAYIAIVRKVEEERISVAQQQYDGLMLVSKSTPPQKSLNAGRILYAFTGGVVGFLFTVLAILGYEWWRKPFNGENG